MNAIHFIELRERLLKCTGLIVSIFAVLFYFSENLYTWFSQPLLQKLPEGYLIATEITSLFTVPTKLAFVMACFFSVPYVLYQAWSFIAPALYDHERHFIFPLVFSSSVLFYSGVLFSYFILCPISLTFFSHSVPKGVQMMTDIKHYLEFMLTLLTAGGIAFQIPLLTFLSIRFRWVTLQQWTYFRPYVIVGVFTLGMILTPPDVLSQILLALPMWALFEMGILAAKQFPHSKHNDLPQD